MILHVEPADLKSDAFAAMVDRHVAFCDGTAPAESCHRLTASQLDAPDIRVWQARRDAAVLGMVAVKQIAPREGEVKSMHTLAEARGTGVGRLLLEAVIADAQNRDFQSLWLETGVHADFTAARALYAAYGFVECPPFGAYKADPHSLFMTLTLAR